MVNKTDMVNLALQSFGSRTTVTAAELLANSSNEAIQANLTYDNTRDGLLRMAPWDCAFFSNTLVYISSVPGTPENTSPATTFWQPGQPAMPWAYEYQYPADCLRACYITPQAATGFAGGIPVTSAVTGGAPSLFQGPPVRFKIAVDRFYPVISAVSLATGSNYAVGDSITLAAGATSSPPIGAPAKLIVLSAPGGVCATVGIVNQVRGADPNVTGSYFARQTNPVAQGTTTGVGTSANFNLTYGEQDDQRVILTNQEYAILNYVRAVTNEAVWDPLFQDAFQNTLGADICVALSGDKALANMCIQRANNSILEARKADGNEGLTINDTTPDWIRGRGVEWVDSTYFGSGFDWGGLLPSW